MIADQRAKAGTKPVALQAAQIDLETGEGLPSAAVDRQAACRHPRTDPEGGVSISENADFRSIDAAAGSHQRVTLVSMKSGPDTANRRNGSLTNMPVQPDIMTLVGKAVSEGLPVGVWAKPALTPGGSQQTRLHARRKSICMAVAKTVFVRSKKKLTDYAPPSGRYHCRLEKTEKIAAVWRAQSRGGRVGGNVHRRGWSGRA